MGECYYHGISLPCSKCREEANLEKRSKQELMNKKTYSKYRTDLDMLEERRKIEKSKIKNLFKDFSNEDLLFILNHFHHEIICHMPENGHHYIEDIELAILRGEYQEKIRQ